MAGSKPKRRLISLPIPQELHTDVLARFKEELGYAPGASIVTIALHPNYVSVTLMPKPGVRVTQRHAVVGRELDDDA